MAELRHLRYFVAVAQELHFGRAALRLRIAQPSLSRQIRDLEDEIGVRLFSRDRRGVALTEGGAELLDRVAPILDRVADAVDAARRTARGERGHLRLAYLPSTVSVSRGLPAMVRAFRTRYPEVTTEMHEAWPEQQMKQLIHDEVDVAFTRGPIHEPSLVAEVIFEEPLVVALPAGHPLAHRRRIALPLLATERFLLPDRARGAEVHDDVVALCHGAGFSPRVVQHGTQLDLVTNVAAGTGVALVPASMRRILRAGIAYRPLREHPTMRVLMAWSRAAQSAVLRAFVAHVRSAQGIG